MSDPVFLDVEDVLLIHEEQLARYGGAAGVRDASLLESAVAVPRASAAGAFAHEDVFAMAAAYAFHIAQNQPFVDGNKRSGLLAAIVFLDLNGVSIADPEGQAPEHDATAAIDRVDHASFLPVLEDGGSCHLRTGAVVPQDSKRLVVEGNHAASLVLGATLRESSCTMTRRGPGNRQRSSRPPASGYAVLGRNR